MSGFVRGIVLLALIAAGLGLAVTSAGAVTRTVTVFTDTNPGTPPGTAAGVAGDLRHTLLQATAGDEIVFNCASAPCLITLGGPLQAIMDSLTIDGGTPGRIIIDGDNLYRAFFVENGTVTLRNLTIRKVRAKGGDGGNGVQGGGGGAGLGAGLFVNKVTANVTIDHVDFDTAAVVGGNGGSGSNPTGGSGGGGGLGANGGDSDSPSGGGGGGGVVDSGSAPMFGQGGEGGVGGGGGGFGANGGGGVRTPYPSSPPGGEGDWDAGGNGSFGGGGGGGGGGIPGMGGFGAGGGAAVVGAVGGDGGAGGGGGSSPGSGGIGGALGGGIAGGNAANGTGGGGAAAGAAVFVHRGSLTTIISTATGLTATGGSGGNSGGADPAAIFNYQGMVNGSTTPGPITDALPPPAYGLTVSVSGSGRVTSSSGGVDCPGACDVAVPTYTGGTFTSVTLTAIPQAGASFLGWSGTCGGTTTTALLVMSTARACTAAFTTAQGSGGGGGGSTPAPPTPQPSFVTTSVPMTLNASTVGAGSGSFSFVSSFANPSGLTFSAAQASGTALPSWLTFTPTTVSFAYDVPIPPDLPIQPLADVPADTRSGRADARASWANTVYPLLVRVAQIPVTLTATGGGQSYAATIQMSFYAPRSPVAMSAVSLSLDGARGNGRSGRSALSWDGGQMVFETAATNIFSATVNSASDIVRYQALSGDRDRLSQTAIPGGGVANAADGASTSPAVAADGRHAAFASAAPGITLIPAGRVRQVYRVALGYPRVPLNEGVTPAPDFVSITPAGVAGNGASDNPDLSQDGRYVVFESVATNFGSGLDGTRQIWRKDLRTGALELVSGTLFPGNGASGNPSISWDGRYVAYDNGAQIQLRDMTAGTIRQVAAGTRPRLSARADRIAFVAATGGRTQVMIADLGTGAIRPVTAGNGDSDQPAISADGRFVAFRSAATDLLPGFVGNGQAQIFVRDVDRGVTALVTQTATGAPGNGASWSPALSGDGGTISFGSDARDLVNGNPASGQAYLSANPLPLPEKTGYWYMAQIGGGQGWAVERWGNKAYVGGLAYDTQGRSLWQAGSCTLSGLTCSGTLTGGPAFAIATATTGNSAGLVVGGAAVQALTMFPIGGTRTTGYAGLPQSGWWHEPAAGNNVGYFLDIDSQPQPDGSVAQVGYLAVLGYDPSGAQVWQVSQAKLGDDLNFSGQLTQYAGGAPFGAAAPAGPATGTVVGPVRMTFDGSDRARISLPDGRVADLARFRF